MFRNAQTVLAYPNLPTNCRSNALQTIIPFQSIVFDKGGLRQRRSSMSAQDLCPSLEVQLSESKHLRSWLQVFNSFKARGSASIALSGTSRRKPLTTGLVPDGWHRPSRFGEFPNASKDASMHISKLRCNVYQRPRKPAYDV